VNPAASVSAVSAAASGRRPVLFLSDSMSSSVRDGLPLSLMPMLFDARSAVLREFLLPVSR
jgi:hypothetical protein